MEPNYSDPLPLGDEPIGKAQYVFSAGDTVAVRNLGRGKILHYEDTSNVRVRMADGGEVRCNVNELIPSGFLGAEKAVQSADDFLPVGESSAFVKSRKTYAVGDEIRTTDGALASVVKIENGRMHYKFAGGEGFLLNG